MSLDSVRQAIIGVQVNMERKSIPWSGWRDVDDIITSFDIGELTVDESNLLSRAIETNGESLITGLPDGFFDTEQEGPRI